MKKVMCALFMFMFNVYGAENSNQQLLEMIIISEKTFIKVGNLFWQYDNKDKKIKNVAVPPAGSDHIDLELHKVNEYDVISKIILHAPNDKDYIYFNGNWIYPSQLSFI